MGGDEAGGDLQQQRQGLDSGSSPVWSVSQHKAAACSGRADGLCAWTFKETRSFDSHQEHFSREEHWMGEQMPDCQDREGDGGGWEGMLPSPIPPPPSSESAVEWGSWLVAEWTEAGFG